VTDPGPPPPDDPSSPAVGPPPPASTDVPDPTSEFLTPVRPYETFEPGPGAPELPGSTVEEPTGATGSSARRPASGVVALVVVMAVAAAVGVVVATSGGPSASGSPAMPGDLRARPDVCVAPTCERIETTVELTWAAPDRDVEAIEVLVDGSVLARLDPSVTGYEVGDLWIDRSYTFGVRAIGADGASPVSTVRVTTPVPPPEEAQLDGSYRVRETVRTAFNLSTLEGMDNPQPGSVAGNTWAFSALCADDAGACPANWFRWGPLVNDGRRYEGTFPSQPATCAGGRRTPTTTRMQLVVEGGRASGGLWFVGRFHGVMTLSFTCPGGGRSAGVLLIEGRVLA
jgi:hypothetical protein